MKYLWKLFLSLKEIFLIMIIQYVILILCILTIGIDKSVIYGSILLMMFEMGYIIWKMKSNVIAISKISFNIKSYFPYILLGIGITTVYNMILFKLKLGQEVTTDFPIILNILCSGIIGPIFEEILFRYDYIRRLEMFNSKKWIIILIASIVFGLIHTGITTIIYTMIVGLINSYIYVEDKDIMKPIILHIAGNIFVNFLFGYNICILIFGIILIILGGLIIKDD